jgi:tRNA 2-thiouridine synthesizing protein E
MGQRRGSKAIDSLRGIVAKKGVVPTIYETCEDNSTETDAREGLFPDGYRRGAVKIAGLRAR